MGSSPRARVAPRRKRLDDVGVTLLGTFDDPPDLFAGSIRVVAEESVDQAPVGEPPAGHGFSRNLLCGLDRKRAALPLIRPVRVLRVDRGYDFARDSFGIPVRSFIGSPKEAKGMVAALHVEPREKLVTGFEKV